MWKIYSPHKHWFLLLEKHKHWFFFSTAMTLVNWIYITLITSKINFKISTTIYGLFNLITFKINFKVINKQKNLQIYYFKMIAILVDKDRNMTNITLAIWVIQNFILNRDGDTKTRNDIHISTLFHWHGCSQLSLIHILVLNNYKFR